MNKTKLSLLMACGMALSVSNVVAQTPNDTPKEQMENLDRGLVVIPDGTLGRGNFISWRLLGTDDLNTRFSLYKNGDATTGTLLAKDIKGGTCYIDSVCTASDTYSLSVTSGNGGDAVSNTPLVAPWDGYYKKLKLQKPDPTVNNNDTLYYPNDCSVGDVDGDGQYEIIVKWDPQGKGPSKDNSQKGKTCNVILDCYKLDGTRLWSINLGPNIRAGAHYTQFLVYDFDGDGKAEVICKTAPWSKDGQGNFVTAAADDDEIKNADNSVSYRNSNGFVLSGPEYLTVFNGQTGAAINTIFYRPNRAGGVGGSASLPSDAYWGKKGDNGNRADRFLATVAYLGGRNANPSAVFVRGYYMRSFFWAVDFDGSKLKTRWLHESADKNTVNVTDANGNVTTTKHTKSTSGKGSATAYNNGNHNLSCADVDGDGKDEIIMGSCAIDDDGSLLYATGMGHGDAMHLGDLNPDRPGLEVFEVHEEKNMPYGWDVHDAATGEILYSASGTADNGRGMAADVMSSNRGYEFWSSNDRDLRSASSGEVVGTKHVSQDFRLYWDGDLQDELFDGKYSNNTGKCSPQVVRVNADGTQAPQIKVNGFYFTDHENLGDPQTCNTTKATPCLIADIFGDWREEIVMWDWSDKATLDIYSTTIPTEYRIPTLMHDHTYRMGITWQQTAYNQPAHLGYYLPDYATSFDPTGIRDVKSEERRMKNQNAYNLAGQRVNENHKGLIIQAGKKRINKL